MKNELLFGVQLFHRFYNKRTQKNVLDSLLKQTYIFFN